MFEARLRRKWAPIFTMDPVHVAIAFADWRGNGRSRTESDKEGGGGITNKIVRIY